MAVIFSYADGILRLKDKRKIKAFILNLFQTEKRSLETLTYVFCSDAYLLDINRRFLNHDFYTDIITFDLSDDKSIGTVGEIYISIERVQDNSSQLNTSFTNEMLRVIFHGALHLCGYRDKTKSESLLMRKMEDHYLRLFNLQTK